MNSRKTRLILALALIIGGASLANAQFANVEIRAENAVTPDTINGLSGMIASNIAYRFVISSELDFLAKGASLGFVIYSPDASVTNITHVALPDSLPAWWNIFDLSGVQLQARSYDGILPDSLLGGWATLNGGFGPTSLVDVIDLTISVEAEPGSIICFDSTFIPPAGPWIYANGETVFPSWGASVGGYPDGGYCLSVMEGCCVLPGDADYSGENDIADVIFIIRYIFRDGANPPCLDQADPNGDGQISISDALYLFRWISSVGASPAPVCGTTGT
ncbi:MAG: hypothetical protein IIB00_04675 [candidate division Zixibacteria bacterium]|nr:hypothetical protein [candidate division Zixibacteria bacterium]